ncbi:hypothetical protein CMQ_6606 [Grosmannia clavigera kw1407]|uniref:Uncharacterized protein n=1 Tax=Grosmannia clavigera (strain kw1407 / UAMH 11150) TaxID=655863 RepID=F0X6R9_GROCL|nr:uncharacterized protein CMQ_6606 [Grosmannia clavigera kw1407]EFX06285.1 hypothetical protein CMQ_6606 [Grosmannia clavigera kw1407]
MAVSLRRRRPVTTFDFHRRRRENGKAADWQIGGGVPAGIHIMRVPASRREEDQWLSTCSLPFLLRPSFSFPPGIPPVRTDRLSISRLGQRSVTELRQRLYAGGACPQRLVFFLTMYSVLVVILSSRPCHPVHAAGRHYSAEERTDCISFPQSARFDVERRPDGLIFQEGRSNMSAVSCMLVRERSPPLAHVSWTAFAGRYPTLSSVPGFRFEWDRELQRSRAAELPQADDNLVETPLHLAEYRRRGRQRLCHRAIVLVAGTRSLAGNDPSQGNIVSHPQSRDGRSGRHLLLLLVLTMHLLLHMYEYE